MAKGSNKISDTVRTVVVTLLVSSTVFYMLGTMNKDDADLHISSDTYKYVAEGTHIFTDTTIPEDAIRLAADTDDAHETDKAPPADTASEDMPEESGKVSFEETAQVTDLPSVIETAVPAETSTLPESETFPSQVQDNVENTVYWVKSGEVWHLNDKCSSLSRSKQILSGTVEEAMTSGKSRVCKLCGK